GREPPAGTAPGRGIPRAGGDPQGAGPQGRGARAAREGSRRPGGNGEGRARSGPLKPAPRALGGNASPGARPFSLSAAGHRESHFARCLIVGNARRTSLLFPTATFTIFFLVVLPLSWLAMANMRRWRAFIIAASYVFYGWWDWHFVFLLAGCTIWNYLLAIQIFRAGEQRSRKAWLILAIAGDLALLGYFKY